MQDQFQIVPVIRGTMNTEAVGVGMGLNQLGDKPIDVHAPVRPARRIAICGSDATQLLQADFARIDMRSRTRAA
jgi:hypothetical protein